MKHVIITRATNSLVEKIVHEVNSRKEADHYYDLECRKSGNRLVRMENKYGIVKDAFYNNR